MSDTDAATASPAPATQSANPAVNLVKVKVDSENTAFNLIVGFIGIAQRRGAFALDEAAKIFECIEKFKKSDQ